VYLIVRHRSRTTFNSRSKPCNPIDCHRLATGLAQISRHTIDLIRPSSSIHQSSKLLFSSTSRSKSLGISTVLVQTSRFASALFGYLLLHFVQCSSHFERVVDLESRCCTSQTLKSTVHWGNYDVESHPLVAENIRQNPERSKAVRKKYKWQGTWLRAKDVAEDSQPRLQETSRRASAGDRSRRVSLW
jgi:hypothetical protein